MLIRSRLLRLLFSLAFGVFVGLATFGTGASPAWAVPLAIVAAAITFVSQTYYAKRSHSRKGDSADASAETRRTAH